MAEFEFKDHTGKVQKEIEDKIKKALLTVGVDAVSYVQEEMERGYARPPIDTGNLQGSINFKPQNENEIEVGTNVEYAIPVHEGTRFMSGRPFLKDGIQKNEDKLLNVLANEIKID